MIYTEEVELKNDVSGPAKAAAESVRALEHQMQVLQKAVTSTTDQMQKAMARGDEKAFWKLASASAGYKNALGELSPKLSSAQQQLKGLEQQTQGTTSSTMGLQAELAEMTGGLSIAIEVIGAVGLAFGAVVLAGASLAIEASELREKMETLFDALGEGQISGKETISMLDDLADSIGSTRAKLAPLASEFMRMGITGKDQLKGLTLAAASAGALAEGGGEAFTKMFAKVQAAAETGQALKIPLKGLASLKSMGLDVADVAREMKIGTEDLARQLKAGTVDAGKFGDAMQDALINKGAGPLERAGNALSSMSARLKENFLKLFEDIDVAPFLGEVRQLFDIFGQGKASGNALKSGIGGFFKEVFASATKVVPMVKHFLLDCIIFGLKAYVALKPIAKWFLELRNNATFMAIVTKVFQSLKVAALVVAVVIGAVVLAFAALVGIGVAIAATVWTVIGALISLSASIGDVLINMVAGAIRMGSDFVDGLISGIKSGAGAVVDAVKGLASGAKNAFKNALGIASPSKVMMQLGGHVAGGVAEGMTASAPDVHAASGELAGAAAGGFASAAGGGGRGGGGGGSSVSVTVEKGAITIEGGGKSAEEITEAMLSLVFERVALAQGLG